MIRYLVKLHSTVGAQILRHDSGTVWTQRRELSGPSECVRRILSVDHRETHRFEKTLGGLGEKIDFVYSLNPCVFED